MKTLQQQVSAELSRLLSLWKIRALFGTQFVMLAEAGKAAVVRESWMAMGVPSCRYGEGDFGKLRLNADGTTSDRRFTWAPLTKNADMPYTGSLVLV